MVIKIEFMDINSLSTYYRFVIQSLPNFINILLIKCKVNNFFPLFLKIINIWSIKTSPKSIANFF